MAAATDEVKASTSSSVSTDDHPWPLKKQLKIGETKIISQATIDKAPNSTVRSRSTICTKTEEAAGGMKKSVTEAMSRHTPHNSHCPGSSLRSGPIVSLYASARYLLLTCNYLPVSLVFQSVVLVLSAKSVQFLGYIIDHHGVRMDEGKVEAVVSWTKPNSIKELQRFLGFANFYRRFIKGYSQITNPLTNLLEGHPKTLNWTTEATTSFKKILKKAFTQAPLLTHPDPNLPFVVEVDASTTGVGAVHSQHHGNPPRLHPCAYFSRKLSPAERNYDIGNRELLAIKLALEEWRHWLEGANHPFQVITDHKNLQYLRDAKRLCPRQARWALFFTRFNFSISYRPGSKNVRADALSRLSEGGTNTEAPSSIIPNHLIVSPIDWTEPPVVATPEPRVPLGCPPGRKFIPAAQRVNLIHATYTSLGTGHPGANNTLSLLTDRFWWPDMARDVRRYVQGCKECAMSKSPRHLPAGKLHPLPIPNRPWSHLGVDFMTDLPVSDENTCILVIVDRFSKFCRLIPLKGLPTALETGECLFNHVFHYYGLPEDIVSDRGPQFISRVWKAFFKLLGVTVSLSSGYHPQTNGQTERKIQEVGRFLRTFCHGHRQNSWNQFLGWAEYAQNSLRQPSTGLTPFQCVLGFQPPLFPWNGEPSDVPAVDHWFRESERVWDAAHHHLQRAVNRSKAVSGRRSIPGPNFTPGQKVWLSTRDIRLRLPSKKLSPRFIGPFTILRKDRYTQYVNEILQSRRRGGRLEYLVDWEGYGPEERSWVPCDDILGPALISEFNAAHPEYPAPRGRGRPPRRRRFRPSGAGRGEGGNVMDWPGSNTVSRPCPSAVCVCSAILVILEYLREEKIVNQRSIHFRTFKTVDVYSPVEHLQSPRKQQFEVGLDGLEWCGLLVDYCDVSISYLTLVLTATIHCRGSFGGTLSRGPHHGLYVSCQPDTLPRQPPLIFLSSWTEHRHTSVAVRGRSSRDLATFVEWVLVSCQSSLTVDFADNDTSPTPDPVPSPTSPRSPEHQPEPTADGEPKPSATDKPSARGATELRIAPEPEPIMKSPLGSLVPPAPPWLVIAPPSPQDSTPPAAPRHSVPPAPLGSSLPPAPPQSSVAPAPLRTSGSLPQLPEPWILPWPSGSSMLPGLLGSPSPPPTRTSCCHPTSTPLSTSPSKPISILSGIMANGRHSSRHQWGVRDKPLQPSKAHTHTRFT
ncbi:Transposon Tf2-9 polyprotein [Labeo rohita]|uniref:Gypsy retrotransposon integrase-like protein 1 n=1 Tax=Labeo rohita TaxID=84645 RepID=A0ABQ8MN60_LABRO|nr:Transposon Tf2-9 polyprotein [Labeo rohita]